jgi:hypothetical protein
MSQYDAIARPIMDFDSQPRNADPYSAILPSKQIICSKNPLMASLRAGDRLRQLAVESSKMDFEHPDSAPARKLNEILWKSVKGVNSELPAIHKRRIGADVGD